MACRKDGSFTFYTYTAGDGVPVGSYVVLFAELHPSRQKGLIQPDGLKNLYDDPDKNGQNKDFVVTVAEPGKTDYDFNLDLAGKEPATPGPHAVAEIRKDKKDNKKARGMHSVGFSNWRPGNRPGRCPVDHLVLWLIGMVTQYLPNRLMTSVALLSLASLIVSAKSAFGASVASSNEDLTSGSLSPE